MGYGGGYQHDMEFLAELQRKTQDSERRSRPIWVVDATNGARIQRFGSTSGAMDWIEQQRHPSAYRIE